MSNPVKCSATTKKGKRCKNIARFGNYCSIHRHLSLDLPKSGADHDQRLVNLLVAATSLIVLVEKGLEYLPQLFELIARFSPPQRAPIMNLTYIKEDLERKKVGGVFCLAQDIENAFRHHDWYKDDDQSDLVLVLPSDFRINLRDECARLIYLRQLVENVSQA